MMQVACALSVHEVRHKYLGDYKAYYEHVVPNYMTKYEKTKPSLIVRQTKDADFTFEDYPFLDPRYNENVPQNTTELTQTYWTDAFLYFLDDPEVVEGSIIAFFQDIRQSDASNTVCYTSFEYMRDLILKAEQLFENMNWFSSQPIQLVQLVLDVDIQYFQFYADCGVENFLIDISMKYFTLRGITSNLVNIYYVLDQILNDGDLQRKFIVAMNQANFSHTKNDWQSVGLYVGMLINQITGYRVPGYEYIYGQSVIRDLQAEQNAAKTE